ncbi:hypothetical protein CKALI_11495 [Corynebacterium kalinowskii]|uniref:Uncharacterized protein n=1 Tax=Corynebacterium kalinowskii TaxID=2675216 RepID=A0A6B8VG78_9CORY|nr:hypothetical protein [Corynebacterium kalinowskii]QGU03143.1 hypothetical protein CKALI_11495 [Corynebacterium kalinowskii]
MTEDRFRWFTEATAGDSLSAVAERCGLDREMLRLEFVEDRVTAETVIAIAKEYKNRTTIGLVLCGLIPKSDVTTPLSREELISLATLDEILGEFTRRVKKNPELAKELVLEIARLRAEKN